MQVPLWVNTSIPKKNKAREQCDQKHV